MTTLIPKFDLMDGGTTPTGAINRAINKKLQEIVSVKDFGAVGDGSTDDTTAIQAAITAGNVFFPPSTGNYIVTAQITVPSNRVIKGPGIVQVPSNLNPFKLDGVTNVTFDGLGCYTPTVVQNPTYWIQCLVQLKQTTLGSPCTQITVTNCNLNNISAIRSEQAEHTAGSGYPYAAYSSIANRHRQITVTNNICVKTDATTGTAPDNQGYFVWLWFVDNVIVANNNVQNKWGLCYIAGGSPAETGWLVSYQYSANIVINGNATTGAANGIVFIACTNAVASNNSFTTSDYNSLTPFVSLEILDSEGGRDVTFNSNTIYGGQTPFNAFYTNNNLMYKNNTATATVYNGGAGGNGTFRNSASSTNQNIEQSGRISFVNNKIESTVACSGISVGLCKEFIFTGNQCLNVGIYSNTNTNILIIKDNVFDWTLTPYANTAIIYTGNAQGYGAAAPIWSDYSSTFQAKIVINDNIINGNNYGGSTTNIVTPVAPGIYLTSCQSSTNIEIQRNKIEIAYQPSLYIGDGNAKARTILVIDNLFEAPNATTTNALDHGTVTATDKIMWKDNMTFNGLDQYGTITGTTQAQLLTNPNAGTPSGMLENTLEGSRIWNNSNSAADNVGWVFDSTAVAWRKFGITY